MPRPKKPAPPWSPTYEDWSPPVGSYPCFVEDPRVTALRNVLRILNEYRRRTGHGYRYVAKLSGIPKATLACYRRGTRYPGADTLQRLAQFFGISVDTFFRTDL